jgi:SAM-dependent methyltransferase
VYLWRRTAEIQSLKAHQDLLQAYAHGQLVILRRPRRKFLQLEIVRSSQKASRGLVADFGGHIEKLPRNWLERFPCDDSKSIKIGKRLIVVKPAIERPGGHATTAMSLRLLEELTRYWKRGWSVLDLGTGSGILALAASRFGAGRVLGLDTDPVAISTAKSSARLNRIRGATFQLGDVRKWKSVQPTRVITANLYSDLLIEILPNLRRNIWLILSGILRGQETEFVGALRRNKIKIIQLRRRGKWIAILAHCGGALRARVLGGGKFCGGHRPPLQ